MRSAAGAGSTRYPCGLTIQDRCRSYTQHVAPHRLENDVCIGRVGGRLQVHRRDPAGSTGLVQRLLQLAGYGVDRDLEQLHASEP